MTKNYNSEYVFATSKGLRFGFIDLNQFIENKNEYYLTDKTVSSVAEYKKGFFAVGIYFC